MKRKLDGALVCAMRGGGGGEFNKPPSHRRMFGFRKQRETRGNVGGIGGGLHKG